MSCRAGRLQKLLSKAEERIAAERAGELLSERSGSKEETERWRRREPIGEYGTVKRKEAAELAEESPSGEDGR